MPGGETEFSNSKNSVMPPLLSLNKIIDNKTYVYLIFKRKLSHNLRENRKESEL